MGNAICEWAGLDATAQAELVHSGEATPAELVEAARERIERVDVLLNAVPVRCFEEALAAAEAVPRDAPFAGVPFLLKDFGARQAGQPYYAGNRSLRDADHRADADTLLGARFRELGLVTLGNSSTPEFGLQSNTWPLAYGPTRNPWDLERSSGGSSGGACAAVAAGLVPVAHASDGVGSIRIPAAWCGLIGLKPSRDRVDWRHRGTDRSDIEFVVARSLRDTAAFLDLLRPTSERRSEPRRYRDCLDLRPARLRVAICTDAPGGDRVDEACARAAREVGEALARLGHRVTESKPASFEEHAERAVYGALAGLEEYRDCLRDLEARLGRSVTSDDVEPYLWTLAFLEAEQLSPEDLAEAAAWSRGWAERTLAWFCDFDLLITPAVPESPPPLDALHPERNAPLELLEKMLPHMAFTEPWSATGQPALSLPWGIGAEGLPIGVQLVAGPERDDLLISVAAVLLEGREPLRPPLHA